MNWVYQHIQKYSHIYIQKEHFFPKRICSAMCWFIFPPHWKKKKKKVLEKHRTMLSCTKPCKKGRRVARRFQGFVIKTHKEVLKKILVHPKNPTLLEYLHPGAQDAKWNNLSLLWTPFDASLCWRGLDAGGDPILSWQQGEFCWNPPSSCSDRIQDDKGSSTGVCHEMLSSERAFPCSLAVGRKPCTSVPKCNHDFLWVTLSSKAGIIWLLISSNTSD